MRLLVTGGSGFIGTNFIAFLRQQDLEIHNIDTVEPLDRTHLPHWVKADILEAEALREVFQRIKPTHVVHLAARTDLIGRTAADYRANTDGMANVLSAMAAAGTVTRAILTSSMLVCRPGYQPRNDTDYDPHTAYGESKVATEQLVRAWGPSSGVEWIVARPTTIWGPWHLRLQRELFHVIAKGLYVHPGGNTCRRTYGFAGNAVEQLHRLLTADAASVNAHTFYLADPTIDLYEFVNGFSMSLRGKPARRLPKPIFAVAALAGDLARACRLPAPMTSSRLRNMTEENVIDISATLQLCGQPRHSLEQGIARTCDWLRTR